MTYIEKVVDTFLKIHPNMNFRSCASYLQVADGRLNPMFQKLVKITARNTVQWNSQAEGVVKKEFFSMYPSVMADVRAPCYASFSRFGNCIQHLSNVQLVEQKLANIRQLDKDKILPASDVMLSRALMLNSPSYIVLFPRWMQTTTPASIQVYNLLLEEPWIKEHLYRKKNSYKLHVKEGCILKVGKDDTLQKIFGVCMALRMCMEHARGTGNSFNGLINLGFPPKIAARLSLYLGTYKGKGTFDVGPNGHSFAQGGVVTQDKYEACFKDVWEIPWDQDKSWAKSPRGTLFYLFRVTSAASYPHPPVYKNKYIVSSKPPGSWYESHHVDGNLLKKAYDESQK